MAKMLESLGTLFGQLFGGSTTKESLERDPRAPKGMSDIEYRGWKDRRDIADAYIKSVDTSTQTRKDS